MEGNLEQYQRTGHYDQSQGQRNGKEIWSEVAIIIEGECLSLFFYTKILDTFNT
jgi:hypothetical protein